MANFEYIKKYEYKQASKNIWKYVRKIQEELRKENIRINPILIGSSRYRLVTRDLSTQTFDFDFNLFIARIGEDLLENPDKIRQTFLDILDRNNEDFEFEKTKKNGSRTIKIKHQDGEYRVEFAILKYIDEQINILKLDTNTNKCIFI